jgi:hypothetical protein
MKLEIPCLFKLSSQRHRNDLIASPTYANKVVTFLVVNDCSGSKGKMRSPVGGHDSNNATVHNNNGNDDVKGGGDCAS